MSLGLVWGFGGIMSFGQTAFFGIGGYTYAIAVENIGDSTLPLLLSIAVPAAFAALLGYFMFFGRLGDVFVGVVTLCVSLILFDFGNSTRDSFYTIAKRRAERLQRDGRNPSPQCALRSEPNAQYEVDVLSVRRQSDHDLCLVPPRPGLALRPHRGGGQAERDSSGAPGLQRRRREGRYLYDRGRRRRLRRMPVCELERLYQSWRVRPADDGADDHLGGCRLGSALIGPVLGSVGLQYLVMVLGAAAIVDVNLVLGLLTVGIVEVFSPRGRGAGDAARPATAHSGLVPSQPGPRIAARRFY